MFKKSLKNLFGQKLCVPEWSLLTDEFSAIEQIRLQKLTAILSLKLTYFDRREFSILLLWDIGLPSSLVCSPTYIIYIQFFTNGIILCIMFSTMYFSSNNMRGTQKTGFIYKKLCICSHMFKLQSPSKYSLFDTIHLSRHFFHC